MSEAAHQEDHLPVKMVSILPLYFEFLLDEEDCPECGENLGENIDCPLCLGFTYECQKFKMR